MSISINVLCALLASLTTGEPQNDAKEGQKKQDVAYIGGKVERVGVYTVARADLQLTDLLVAAGAKLDQSNLSIHLIRVGNDHNSHEMVIPMPLLMGENAVKVTVKANDKIQVVADEK